MSWRTVILAERAKIDYSMGYMVIRGRETHRVFMDEVGTIMVESTAISFTAAWVSECIDRKIKIIFCNEKRNPAGEIVPYCGSYDTSRKLRSQIRWCKEWKDRVWTAVVEEKIRQQMVLLQEFEKKEAALLLDSYISQVQQGDSTNREGHAAKVYFNALFAPDFVRGDDTADNNALNYGYAIILSAFNREIAASGYITQLGIFHDNIFNPFNLGCDLMEPFRPLVDRAVLHMQPTVLATPEKLKLVDLLNHSVTINEKKTTVNQAIGIFCRSVFDAIEGEDLEKLRFYRYGM